MSGDKRSFKIVEVADARSPKGKHNLGGRYLGSTPLSAAKKAFTRVCRDSAIRGQCTFVIKIQETTRGSNGKIFAYKGKRVMNPVTVMRNGVEVTYKYQTNLVSLRD
jgi:hypothetical protein